MGETHGEMGIDETSGSGLSIVGAREMVRRLAALAVRLEADADVHAARAAVLRVEVRDTSMRTRGELCDLWESLGISYGRSTALSLVVFDLLDVLGSRLVLVDPDDDVV